ncbi:MAG: response regulator transcription factor [Bacteroides sp.]|jgi:DNA-binding response OmpR family regulator|nr:response regulator transcription factor [Bacteroides sp.]
MKLLIIEDEKELSDSIVAFLNQKEYRCEQAYTCDEAMIKVGLYEYDCILLDLMLPDGSGLDVLREIKRKSPDTGVIIVSAKGALDDKVLGLKIGADDYLPKPFHLPELSMRIYALIRRRNFTGNNLLENNQISIDLLSKEVKVMGRLLDLTKTEYQLLLFLIENRKRVVSKSAVAEHLSGDMADMMDDYSFIYAHIKNLKAKLAAAGCKNCIKTYYGTGYKWVENEESAE